MSRRNRAAAPIAEPRFVVGFAMDDWPWPPRYVEVIRDTLGHGLDVEFRFTREDTKPWFRLRSYRGVAHVLGPDFGHLATVADVSIALTMGWERGGWGGA